MAIVTVDGLEDVPATQTATPAAQWAAAGGAADAITAAYPTPNLALTDGLPLAFRAASTNVTATPTFAPDGLTAHAITKKGGLALKASDIRQNGEYLVRYNLANTRWELYNEAPREAVFDWVASGGTADAITATYTVPVLALTDGLRLAFRATAANATTAPTFAPSGLTAHPITDAGGTTIALGAIPGANAEVLVVYNLANTRWELVNPGILANAQGDLYKVIAAVAGQNIGTVQPWFPSAGAVSVQAGVTYDFEGYLYLSRAAGATSHTTGLSFGGTATLTSIAGIVEAGTGDAAALVAADTVPFLGATNFTVKAASTSTTEQAWYKVKGTVVINAAGTFIPQFTYSAIPGGVPTITASFKLTPRANPLGTWA